jgi:phosphoglycolate phosphatase
MAASALIFDLDGTVWDSYPWYAERIGSGDARRRAVALADLRDAKSAATLLKKAGLTPARFRKVCATADRMRLYPDAHDTLIDLHKRRTALGVVTNLPDWMASPLLGTHGLAGLFGSVVTWGCTSRHKPKPDPLLLCCEELEIAPEDAWYVGDSPNDWRASQAAEMHFAWARWGYCDTPPEGADEVLDWFRDVERL